MNRRVIVLVGATLFAFVAGCGEPGPKSDAELGLNVSNQVGGAFS